MRYNAVTALQKSGVGFKEARIRVATRNVSEGAVRQSYNKIAELTNGWTTYGNQLLFA